MADHDVRDPEKDLTWRHVQLPAIFCDTFSVTVWIPPGMVRLVFGEYTEKGMLPFFRTSVVLPIDDAKALISELTEQIQDAEKKAAAAAVEEKSEAEK